MPFFFLSFFSRDLTTNCGPGDVPPPNRVDTTERLADLRNLMADFTLDAYIVPLDDEGRRSWISGFSGSSGDAIVSVDQVTGNRRPNVIAAN